MCHIRKGFIIGILIILAVISKPVYADEALSGNETESSSDLLYAVFLRDQDGNPFEIRSRAGLDNQDFSVLQGGCSDGKYIYLTFENRKEEQCRIVKLLLNNNIPAIAAVSEPLDIQHGNDIAYNSRTGQLVVVHCLNSEWVYNTKVSIINSEDLTLVETKEIEIPSAFPGATEEQAAGIHGLDAITYNESKDQYAVLLPGECGDFIILDHEFNVVEYFDAPPKYDYVNQGIESIGDSILVSQYINGAVCDNIIVRYMWKDQVYQLKTSIKGLRYEIECIFYLNGCLYAGAYAYDPDSEQKQSAFLYKLQEKPGVYGVSLDYTSLEMEPGQEKQLVASVIPEGEGDSTVSWTSSNQAVADVTQTGLVSARQEGRAVITVRTREGYFVDKCTVNVKTKKAETRNTGVGESEPEKKKPKKKKPEKVFKKPVTPASFRLKRKNGRSLKLAWNRKGEADGYRILISTSKKFRTYKKYVIKNKKTKSVIIKRLKGKKTYYVKMQSFVKHNNKCCFSRFTQVKKVRFR